MFEPYEISSSEKCVPIFTDVRNADFISLVYMNSCACMYCSSSYRVDDKPTKLL